jgi:hypothetical protein
MMKRKIIETKWKTLIDDFKKRKRESTKMIIKELEIMKKKLSSAHEEEIIVCDDKFFKIVMAYFNGRIKDKDFNHWYNEVFNKGKLQIEISKILMMIK